MQHPTFVLSLLTAILATTSAIPVDEYQQVTPSTPSLEYPTSSSTTATSNPTATPYPNDFSQEGKDEASQHSGTYGNESDEDGSGYDTYDQGSKSDVSGNGKGYDDGSYHPEGYPGSPRQPSNGYLVRRGNGNGNGGGYRKQHDDGSYRSSEYSGWQGHANW